MITIAQAIDTYVRKTPFVEEGLAQNILNLTALARMIRPEIEEITHKPVTEAAIVMAFKRRQADPATPLKSINQAQEELYFLKNVTVRSNLVEYALKTDQQSNELLNELFSLTTTDRDLFVSFSQGIAESTLIVSRSLADKVESELGEAGIIERIDDLAAITIRLRPESIYVPGVHYQIIKALAWEGLNIIETISSYSEVTHIVSEKDIDRVFSIIKEITSR